MLLAASALGNAMPVVVWCTSTTLCAWDSPPHHTEVHVGAVRLMARMVYQEYIFAALCSRQCHARAEPNLALLPSADGGAVRAPARVAPAGEAHARGPPARAGRHL